VRKLISEAKMPEELANEIREAYERLSSKLREKNPRVAVRSSATAEDLRMRASRASRNPI